ncbi:MAG: hypothetical protein AAFU73_09475 [Planctomycetota bacterium]
MNTRFVLPAALVLSTAAASAQSALIREDDPAPGGAAGELVTSINGVSANQLGGYVTVLSTDIGGTTTSQIWGSFSGGAGALIRQETTIGNLLQGSFESSPGMGDSTVVYSALCENLATMTTSIDTVFTDATPIAVEEEPIPGSSDFWSFASRPRSLRDGTPVYTAGYRTTPTGSTAGRAFVIGTTELFRTGDTLPNMPFALSSNGIDFDSRASANGTHTIVVCDIDTASAEDIAVAIDGAGLVVAGTLLRESEPIPAALNPVGTENWDNFDFVGITEQGDYFITGDTDGDSATDEFIFRNGDFFVREGNTVDGQVITGSISHAFMNESGTLAYIWDVDTGAGSVEALFVESTLLLRVGDEVDWDGDGSIDPGFVLDDFTGIESMAIGSDGTVYFTADVITPGGELEGLFAIGGSGPSIGTNYCTALANSSGVPAVIRAQGSTTAADNDVTLIASSVPPLQFGIFLTSLVQDQMPLGGGNLCLGGQIGRYSLPAQIQQADAAGTFSLVLDLNQTPQGPGLIAIGAGESWNFQAWFRDGGFGANLTDGIEIDFD